MLTRHLATDASEDEPEPPPLASTSSIVYSTLLSASPRTRNRQGFVLNSFRSLPPEKESVTLMLERRCSEG
jgi:hypothetical protein